MRIMTFNANGIRSAERKGFFTWLAQQNVDFVCIQETKAQVAQLDAAVFYPAPYHCFYHDAQKKATVVLPFIVEKNPMTLFTAWAMMKLILRDAILKYDTEI